MLTTTSYEMVICTCVQMLATPIPRTGRKLRRWIEAPSLPDNIHGNPKGFRVQLGSNDNGLLWFFVRRGLRCHFFRPFASQKIVSHSVV